jgi:hypothetical protein
MVQGYYKENTFPQKLKIPKSRKLGNLEERKRRRYSYWQLKMVLESI